MCKNLSLSALLASSNASLNYLAFPVLTFASSLAFAVLNLLSAAYFLYVASCFLFPCATFAFASLAFLFFLPSFFYVKDTSVLTDLLWPFDKF